MAISRSTPFDFGGSEVLARNRIRFLTAEPVDPAGVRDPVLASWWRSRRFHVPPDHLDPPYVRDPNLDTPLSHSADPVLHSLAAQLDGQPISILLTDPAGVVLTRLTPDSDLERHLDRVHLAPGFSYAEQSVGTNGIGSALEGGRPMHVFGHEHYAEHLEDLACAGVPIHHPVSGKTVGALDLTCWRKDAGPLLVALARTTTEQIRQALLTETGTREIELLREYLRASHRNAGIVIALNDDVAMVNDYARTMLDPIDRDALLRHAADASTGRRRTAEVDLPTGLQARMSIHPVTAGGRPAGVVAHVKLLEFKPPAAAREEAAVSPPSAGPAAGSASRMLLPGLIGSGSLWRRACEEMENIFRGGEWLAVEGEPGVGKLALLRAVHQRWNPAGRYRVLDAADPGKGWMDEVRRTLSDEPGTLVIRHVDQLSGVRIRSLTDSLQEAYATTGDAPVWVAVTVGAATRNDELANLLKLFPRSLQIPPLRHHAEDVPQLASFFLNRLGYGGRLVCSPEVIQVLTRANWPGNAEQLLQALRQVIQKRRTGVIQPDDLPPQILTVSRRLLSTLESMERDAIVRSLQAANNNKTLAAKSLGMSRATIYRKIHEYGIVGP